jgi:catechol-2,3-dioxygenase
MAVCAYLSIVLVVFDGKAMGQFYASVLGRQVFNVASNQGNVFLSGRRRVFFFFFFFLVFCWFVF